MRLISIVTLAFVLMNCGGQTTKEQNTSEGMEQFVEDESFKDAHDEPQALAVNFSGKEMTFPTPDGQTAKAYALFPESTSDQYLLVIHEWWGLNDQIKQEADRLFEALENVNVLALDMYDGKVADNRDDAGKYMSAMQEERGQAIIAGALEKAGDQAKVATVGWCFGGGWSLKASVAAAQQGAGCVMYYGMPLKDKKAIEPLQADVLGIFAKQDGWITPEVADEFKTMATKAGKNVDIHIFDAKHAFANPSSDAYVEEAAQKANALALAFLKEKLK